MQIIKFIQKKEIGILTLNRPEKRNALNPDLVSEIKYKLDELKENTELKILIITGGGSAFCAGADLEYLNKLKNFSLLDNQNDSKELADLFLKIYHFPKPVIAAVNGPAIAGGCGLASVCDFIIADKKNSKFGYSEVKIGFIPAIVSAFLIKRIGESKAKQMLISGKIINSAEALQIGLIDQISENVLDDSLKLAENLKSNSQLSMETTKKMIEEISNLSIDAAVEYCINLNALSRSSKDFTEGLNNFLNKKKI